MQIKNLVFEGGGVKGIAYVGALQALGDNGVSLEQIERVAGTSAGAITACLLAIGYGLEDIEHALWSMDFENLLDQDEEGRIRKSFFKVETLKANKLLAAFFDGSLFDMYNLVDKNFGLFKGVFFRNWINQIILDKTGIDNATFLELHELKCSGDPRFELFKDLYVMGTCLSSGLGERFSWEDTPHMVVADAVRISMSIPIVFYPHQVMIKTEAGEVIQDKTHPDLYVDGGVVDNYPIRLFDAAKYVEGQEGADPQTTIFNYETLGFRLKSIDKKLFLEKRGELEHRTIKNLAKFIMKVGDSLTNAQATMHLYSNDSKRTIYIDNLGVSATDFDLMDEKKRALIYAGKACTYDYFVYRLGKKPFSVALRELTAPGWEMLAPLFAEGQLSVGQGGITLSGIKLGNDSERLYQLFSQGSDLICETVLKLGAEVNGLNKAGDAPIHLAVLNGDHETLARLLKAQADPDLRFSDGEYALDKAFKNNHSKMLQVLVKYGAKSIADPGLLTGFDQAITLFNTPLLKVNWMALLSAYDCLAQGDLFLYQDNRIQTLSLKGNTHFEDEDIACVLKLFPALTSLNVVGLDKITTEGITLAFDRLSELRLTDHQALQWGLMSQNDYINVNHLRYRHTRLVLESVDITAVVISEEIRLGLIRSLEKNDSVHTLNLSSQRLGANGVALLADVMKTNRTLQSLILQDCSFGATGLQFLGELLQANPCINRLDISINSYYWDYDLKNNLERIDLTAEDVEKAWPVFIEGLRLNKSLQYLDLSDMPLTPSCGAKLAQVIEQQGSLIECQLLDTGLADDILVSIGQALEKNRLLANESLVANEGAYLTLSHTI